MFPGRIGLAPSSRPRPPLSTSVKLRPELRPPPTSSSLSEVSSAPNRPTVSSIAASSYSPTFSPPESAPPSSNRSRAAAERAARRPRAPPELPAPARGPLPRALGPPSLPGAQAALPRGRRTPPPPERRVSPPPWPCAAARRRGAPLRLPASHRRAPGSRSASLSPHRPVRRRLTPPPAGNRRAAPPLPRRRRRPLRARALPSAPHARPTPPPCPGRGQARPRRRRAAAGSGRRRRRPVGRRAGPVPWRAARPKQGKGAPGAGPGSLTSGVRLSAPPFIFYVFLSIISAGNS